MKIIEKSVEELTPYENNPRKNDGAVDAVAASIREFGFKVPIIIDKEGVIVAGHTRLKAAKKLGMETVPCIIADDLSPKQIQAFRLADNKTAELADWNFDMLSVELSDLDDIDMSEFGFDMSEFEEPAEAAEDDYDYDSPVESRVKQNDVWVLGAHRLMCGDSTDPAVIDRLMDGVKADMVFCDPPYGMNLNTDYSDMKSDIFKGGIGGKKYEQGKVDEFHPEMIDAVFTIDADEMFLWGADYFAELLPNKNDGSWIVWDKRANGNDDVAEDYSSDKMYGSCFELCWSKKKHKRDIARVKWAGIFGMSSQDQNKRFHPTQKPLELCAWFLNRYSKEKQVVVDLFGGSGSTLIACEQLNRKCYMCELDPHYCDVIINRWEQLTGQKAVLLND